MGDFIVNEFIKGNDVVFVVLLYFSIRFDIYFTRRGNSSLVFVGLALFYATLNQITISYWYLTKMYRFLYITILALVYIVNKKFQIIKLNSSKELAASNLKWLLLIIIEGAILFTVLITIKIKFGGVLF